MRLSRSLVVLTAVSAAAAISACSSSKSTGPSAAKLATTFDSLYRVDSAAGIIRAQFDLLVLVSVNEGITPTTVSVTTDGGPVSMQMVGLVVIDTAAAAVHDSSVVVLGWTSDYGTEVVTSLQGTVGPDRVPPHRIAVSAERMASIRAATNRLMSGGEVTSRAGSASTSAVVVQVSASVSADTVSLIASEAAASGTCTFEGAPTHVSTVTSTSSCTNVTVTETFALHFPATAGIASTLTHMSVAPAKTMHGARIILG